MIPSYLSPAFNHVWQSTVFAVAAGLLALALRKSRAGMRYWLWLAASLKFLVPFSLLATIGSHIEWRTVPGTASSELPLAMEQISRPFIAPLAATTNHPLGLPAAASPISALLFFVWGCGIVVVLFSYWLRWRRIHLAKRQASPVNLPVQIKVMLSSVLLEPAVFGILRPVLLLPEGITGRVNPLQLEAIFAHELCHVRRRDNLTALLHMIVEGIFWFHPLVWWLGARLVEERERACDEFVVQSGNEPQVYAEAILEVCKFYLESPLSCAAGVSGANLKKRIETIMTARIGRKLSLGGKLLLVTAGALAVATPMMVGLLNAPPRHVQSPKAEQVPQSLVALSIKLSASPKPSLGFEGGAAVTLFPGTFTEKYASLRDFIQGAYHLRGFQLAGGPDWIDFRQYEITAKAGGNPTPEQWLNTIGLLLQTLLKDRFKLKFHRETKELPVYVLTVTKSGPKLQRSKIGNCAKFEWSSYPLPSGKWPSNYCGAIATGPNVRLNHTLDAVGMSMTGSWLPWSPPPGSTVGLANFLSGQLGRPVIDKTGLTGLFDLHLEWNFAATAQGLGPTPPRDFRRSALSADPASLSIFTAVQKQLGLKLESGTGPVEVFIVDHAEKPSLD